MVAAPVELCDAEWAVFGQREAGWEVIVDLRHGAASGDTDVDRGTGVFI